MPSLVAEPLSRETRTVEQLGDEVGDDHVLNVNSGAVGNTAHLVEEPLGDVFALLGDDALDHPLGIEQLDSPDLERDLLGLDLEEEADVLADVVAEQGPLLVAHLVRLALDVEHAVAVDFLQEAGPAAGDGLGLGSRRRDRAGADQQPDRRHPQRVSPHGRVSFFIPRFSRPRTNALRLESIPRIGDFQHRSAK